MIQGFWQSAGMGKDAKQSKDSFTMLWMIVMRHFSSAINGEKILIRTNYIEVFCNAAGLRDCKIGLI